MQDATARSKRMPVFKHILDNPYKYQWPVMKDQEGSEALNQLMIVLSKHPKDMLIGINPVTRYLESHVFSDQAPGSLFLFKGDIQASNLYSHLPLLLHLSNPKHLLVPLLKGAQVQVSQKFDIEPFVCIFIPGSSTDGHDLYENVTKILQPVSLPGVSRAQLQKTIKYVPAKIKMIATTAPVREKKEKQKKTD